MMEDGLEGFRLSPQQARVWRSQRDNGDLSQCAVLIEGPVQLDTLQRAVRSIVDRHEILRTRFVRSAGIKLPFQVVVDRAEPSWETHDWTGLAPSRQQADLDLFFEDQRRPLPDLETTPLLRLALFKLTERSHALIVSLPSLTADSATLDNFLQELASSYDAAAGGPPAANATVLQYAGLLRLARRDRRGRR